MSAFNKCQQMIACYELMLLLRVRGGGLVVPSYHYRNLLRGVVKSECDLDSFRAMGRGQPESMRRGIQIKLAENMWRGRWGGQVQRMRNNDSDGHLHTSARERLQTLWQNFGT
jgi:hypothetical protein